MNRLITAIINITAHFTSMYERLQAQQEFEDALNEVIDQRVQKALAERELSAAPMNNKMLPLTLKVDLMTGADIRGAAMGLRSLADQLQVRVESNFNDARFYAFPGDSNEVVEKRLEDEFRRQSRLNKPEPKPDVPSPEDWRVKAVEWLREAEIGPEPNNSRVVWARQFAYELERQMVKSQ